MSRSAHPKLSPAERAHLIVLAQEARRERLERQVERRLAARSEAQHAMEGDPVYRPHVLRNQADQWESRALALINAGRPASRVATRLPMRCYEARHCNRYATESE